MTPGTITFVSAGSRQGVYRPQVRLYYHNARHGICFETMTRPIRCRSRDRAINLAKDWAKTVEFDAMIKAARQHIASNPENQV